MGPGFAPLSVSHQGQFAAVTLSFNMAPGAALSQAQTAIDEARVRIGMPSSVVGSFQGTAKMFSETLQNQVILILAALAALYIVLGILYESLVHPLTILSTLGLLSTGQSDAVGAVVSAVLQLLSAFGVLNNPTSKNTF